MPLPRRDNKLLDALEEKPVESVEITVWRVVKEGRDPCACASSGGRWDDGTFEVLYTSLDRDGAIAEMHYHLKRGQPVFPSKLRYKLYELRVTLDGVVTFPDQDSLAEVGIDVSRFGQLSYQERPAEYPRTQEVSEAVHFLGGNAPGEASGIIVPNARWDCRNLVIFCVHTNPDAVEEVRDHGVIDWATWEREHGRG